ncbi:MAG: hypothetical protein Q7S00_03675 [bacterium]|nr:hypothetical protein [bacterium]
MKGFFALFSREIRTTILLFPAPLFIILVIMGIPLFLDLSKNREFVSIIVFITNIAFTIPPFLLILSFQRDIRSNFSAVAACRASGAAIMLCKYFAALTLGLVISSDASIWPYMDSVRTENTLFQLKQAETSYALLTFRYFLNVLFFSGMVCLSEGLQFMVKRGREIIWIAVFLGGVALLFLPGNAMYTPLFDSLRVQDGFILLVGLIFSVLGVFFFHRYGGVQKGEE